MSDWLIASNNRFKAADLQKDLAFFGLTAIPYTDCLAPLTFPAETTTSYVTNAITKARFLCRQTGQAAIADDSGIEIPILASHLGVTTKRELHEKANGSDNQTLLAWLTDYSGTDRNATMRSTLAVVIPNGPTITATETVTGQIARHDLGRFSTGFDKIFWLPKLGKTLAELPDSQRIPLTHRGRAAQQLINMLRRKELIP
ncbi:non-canonical purine NTP pyrophosphatase [Lentilactobacillus diolivorans]|uniref:non-canonical purine NTP pyrophosphatase n=1 Tax=Lentilactobacillus diolivorans TaxID=179838 RepID=UPI002469A04A|nr:non-canonical purine NTP pyrophosphatase [Lentilactobacillus diolivorans]MDH5106887.1 non-canonical purine NTP pyrophosphatase [Lentilactobacillus diolivorans]